MAPLLRVLYEQYFPSNNFQLIIMAKPAIFLVAPDSNFLKVAERHINSEFGDRFQVHGVDSGASALLALKQLKQSHEPVALFMVEQQMPAMTGIEFLEQAKELFPEAKCVLLTDVDTDADIRAIKTVNIDCYLLKLSDPPENRLYPVLQDLLDDWQAVFTSPFEGIRVIGQRWSSESHEVKDFLGRNQRPFTWLDIETDQEASRLIDRVKSDQVLRSNDPQLPVIIFADGSHLEAPTLVQVAEKIGLTTQPKRAFYDLVIVGGGPAGLGAAVYGASEGLSTVMIEKVAPGGQAGTSSRIENYLGFPAGLSGADLARRAIVQAQRFGVEILSPQEVTGVRVQDQERFVTLADGTEIGCHALLIAIGVSWRKLDVPGVEQLTGRGVYYGAAMFEAVSCRDEEVYIVGGANSAGQAALYFSKYAIKVTILVRGDSLSKGMSQYLIDQIQATENIEVRLRSSVVEVKGENHLEAIAIANAETGEKQTIPATSLFLFIGATPHTDWLADVVERDERGFILAGPDLLHDGQRPQGWTLDRNPFLFETSVPGIFVTGDVRHGSVKRVASAVGQSAVVVQLIHQHLSTN